MANAANTEACETRRRMIRDISAEYVVGCTTVAYLLHPVARSLEGIRAAGLTNVELAAIPGYCEHVDVRDADSVRAVANELEQQSMTAVSLSGHCDLTQRSGYDHIAACIEAAAELGIGIVNTGTGAIVGPAARRRAVDHLRKLAELAQRYGIRIGLETQDDLMTSGLAALGVLDDVGASNVGLNLDAANIVYWGGKRPEDEISLMAPRVIHMHVKDHDGGRGDYVFPPIGEGDLGFHILIETLDKSGFRGPYILEPERSVPGTPKRIASVTASDPGAVYRVYTSSLGEPDARAVDVELRQSLEELAVLLNGQSPTPFEETAPDRALAREPGGPSR
jgi:L-ribulose-5-phosphate 3-epimerase